MKIIPLALLALTCATPAFAQYYDQSPRDYRGDGYRGDGHRDDGHREDGYRGDRYRDDDHRDDYGRGRRVVFGRHCEAFVRTGYGPQRLFCRIIREKPLGEECACPTLPNGPGGPPGPFVGGQTVR